MKQNGVFARVLVYPYALAVVLFAMALYHVPAHAQALGWEGETGVFVTPLAYTASAEGQKFHAVTAYHYLNAGPVIGDFHELSMEVGAGKRAEFGYTREFHAFGGTAGLSQLWQDGFDIFNAKVNLIPENYHKMNWVPQISAGTMIRTGVRNVGDYLKWTSDTNNSDGSHNADIYLVGTKVIGKAGARTLPIPVILNAGVRGTNAELWGMGGNAPGWDARAFGAAAFVVKLPKKATVVFASEASQQPSHPLGYTGPTDFGGVKLNIPTTLTYAARLNPLPKYKLNFDVGVAQIAGEIAPGINLKSRHQVGAQVSYGF
jgi:hypothetical protein